MNRLLTLLFLCSVLSSTAFAQRQKGWNGKFEQLGSVLPSPNEYRTGAGAPGPNYWQQQADYNMNIKLDEEKQHLEGEETITYTNNSPDALSYLWLQLDQNRFKKDNTGSQTKTRAIDDSVYTNTMASTLGLYDYEGGYAIHTVKDVQGKDVNYKINETMMRITLPKPLKTKEKYVFSVKWSYSIKDRMKTWARGGYEYFPEDDNYVYTIAQFFPRMCVYDDYEGWQNKQFLGQGEFALSFGNYKVSITVPADHLVAATGSLQNARDVLSKAHQRLLEKAKNTFDKPVIIASQQEAKEREKKSKATTTKTWMFYAENVRDFAFASSRKFIWDAMAVKIGDKTPLAMSFYPKEGNPLWEKESTKAVKNTLVTYSKYTIDYPYPVAISVHAASLGMEYPMICFNFGRPDKVGFYSDRKKWGMIGVIIHEVGHNFFPMIINSDERQTTWMDEGINTFVQYRTEVENYHNFPSRRGPVSSIVPYMKGDPSIMRPLMTNSEQIIQFGSEQYTKAATALNILRETVMGPELFDYAFKTYAQRWAFKHPKPSDFFRTMEDASAVDLDWFWRGWFYTTDHCDIAVDNVRWFRMDDTATGVEGNIKKVKKGTIELGTEEQQQSKGFNAGPQPLNMKTTPEYMYGEFLNRVDPQKIAKKMQNKNIYEVTLSNRGGLIMPVIIEWTYKDGSTEYQKIPAEIWRIDENEVKKIFMKDKEVVKVQLDPRLETADIETSNNLFPPVVPVSDVERMKRKGKGKR